LMILDFYFFLININFYIAADVGEDPICVVSSAQFLTRSGWLELRNTSDTEPPLRLFRDQRHTFIQVRILFTIKYTAQAI
jgi:hypothetical protein